MEDYFLSEQELIDRIVKCLNENNISSDSLNFLSSRFDNIDRVIELINLLNIDIDENNLKTQEMYYNVLDKVIDSVLNISYSRNKVFYEYPNVVALNDAMIKAFSNTSRSNDLDKLLSFINNVFLFSGKFGSRDYIRREILGFYKFYLKNESIGLGVTGRFCNRILNQHRNNFISVEKDKILTYFKQNVELSRKKKDSIFRGRKLKKIAEIIKNRQYSKLNVTEEYYLNILSGIKRQIINNSSVKKMNIDDIIIDNLALIFNCYGYLDENIVCTILNLNFEDYKDNDVIKYIVKKFESIKVKFLKEVVLNDKESCVLQSEREKVGNFNYREFLIASKSKIYENIAKIVVSIDYVKLDKILNNKEILNEVLYLLPLVDLIPGIDYGESEFDISSFVNILTNYDRAKMRLFSSEELSMEADYRLNLSKLGDLINLVNAYSSINDIVLFALGKDISSEFKEDRIRQYLDFYLKMLGKLFCDIPSISYSNNEYNFVSGYYSDPERLLIGLKTKAISCIDLFEAGAATYTEVLCKSSGDVILVHDNKNNLISRILLFRRGNVVQLVTQVVDHFSIDVYKEIADQIMTSAIENDDNIDFVFVNGSSYNVTEGMKSGYEIISDNRFVDYFPHADFQNSALLLSSKSMFSGSNEESIKMDFEAVPRFKYEKKRKDVSWNPEESEITKLRALSIVMENDKLIKESRARDFSLFSFEAYQKVVCGEDWYIAVRNDGEFEEVCLPLLDERGYYEFYQAKKELLDIKKKLVGKR